MYSRFSNVAKVLSPSSLFNNDDDYDLIIPTGERLWYKTQELNDPRTNTQTKQPIVKPTVKFPTVINHW